MEFVEPQDRSLVEKTAWTLLVLAAALQAYDGLSSVAYVFMGVSSPGSRLGRWGGSAAGALQAIVAVAAFGLAARRNLRGATLAVAGCMMSGWLSTVPSVVEQGLDFRSGARFTSAYFVASPVIAIAAAGLAWRNPRPVLAALIVTAPTLAGILLVIGFGIVIAVYGF